MGIYFEVSSCLGRRIWISREQWDCIVLRKHPELAWRERDVRRTLKHADFVRLSQRDPDVYLYYKRIGEYHVCVVCRHSNGSGFIITSYLTDRPKRGLERWRK